MLPSTTQLVVVGAMALALGYAARTGDVRAGHARLRRRLLYGVPWGTALTVAVLATFYLVVQYGLVHPDEPSTYAFVSWSYFYPLGLVTAGLAHASTAHLVSNLTATVVFGAIVEWTWGHYPPDEPGRARPGSGLRSSPWVRAVALFPLALFVAAFLTAVFSLGPGLGFSGAVYALLGFAAVAAPRLAIGGVVASSALGVLYDALTSPVLRAGIESGAPQPPGWAGVGFHAHLLGFLLGVVAAIGLSRARSVRPRPMSVFAAIVLVGLVQSVWLLVWPGDADTFVMYRGVGVAFFLALSVVVTVAVAGSDRPLPRPLAGVRWVPSRRRLAAGWLGALTILFGLSVVGSLSVPGAAFVIGVSAAAYVLLVLPALPPLLPSSLTGGRVTRRQTAFAGLVAFTAVVALVGVPYGFALVGDDVPGSGAVSVGDYTVTYEENVTADRRLLAFPGAGDQSTFDGVLVASDDRELFTVAERATILEHERETTIAVGGVGWYETVRAERIGWTVLGNETAYAVDLVHDGETTRSFRSDGARVDATIADRRIEIVPTGDAFEIRVERDAAAIGSVPIPRPNATERVGDLEFHVQSDTTPATLYVTVDGTTVQIATRAADKAAEPLRVDAG
ncbi:rhomboid family intramembrane serine protease [Halovivax limisalsi]|uniref:rhomboid family intramembrane serine protease n=1 Tax=Halovivax limisalsi TaxID=1453760 RepID=UPI001FFCA09B|nr:rhomboid family intramembrane serine protease [Halovivax limisalsi]